VVDVGDDAEVPYLRRSGEGLLGETADGNLLVDGVLARRTLTGVDSRISTRVRRDTIAAAGRPVTSFFR
jgi:hypothetical protein